MMPIRGLGRFLLFSFALMLTVACSKKSDSSSNGQGVSVTLKVGQVSNSTTKLNLSNRPPISSLAYSSADVIASNSPFNFAHVDGIKVNVLEVNLKQGSNYIQAASWAAGTKVLEIGAGVAGAISFSEDISIEPGDYTGADLRMDNSYSVKAYCQTSSKFVYTSATGVKTLNSVPSSLPSDYDYYDYSFLEVTTAESPTSTTDLAMASTDFPFSVSDAGGQVAVLVDPSFLVTCYDGTQSSFQVTGVMSPFTWGNNNGYQTTDFFSVSSPHFGMSYIPMFIWISGDASATPPVAETYFIGNASADVTASSIDFSKTGVATVVFNSDDSPYAMRGRLISGNSIDLNQMFNGFTKETDNTYTIYNGEWICDAGYTNCRQIQDRKITGFNRTADYTSVLTTTLEDGPDCGKTGYFPGHEDWGNRYKACMNTPASLYFKKVQK